LPVYPQAAPPTGKQVFSAMDGKLFPFMPEARILEEGKQIFGMPIQVWFYFELKSVAE